MTKTNEAIRLALDGCATRTDVQLALYTLGQTATEIGHKIAGCRDNQEAVDVALEMIQEPQHPTDDADGSIDWLDVQSSKSPRMTE